MRAHGLKPNATLGFLTVVDHQQYGLFGGYLLLNPTGRPLEFHCTAPIKPNRAQEILYGPTLEPFLYGEQIGRTLLAKAGLEPSVVCTDREPVLAVCAHVSVPVALILTADSPEVDQAGRFPRLHADCSGIRGLKTIQVGRNRLVLTEQSDGDRRQITEQLARLPESFDLSEPFARIREAIQEAQQAARSPSCRAA
jgi:hypothetical protein